MSCRYDVQVSLAALGELMKAMSTEVAEERWVRRDMVRTFMRHEWFRLSVDLLRFGITCKDYCQLSGVGTKRFLRFLSLLNIPSPRVDAR